MVPISLVHSINFAVFFISVLMMKLSESGIGCFIAMECSALSAFLLLKSKSYSGSAAGLYFYSQLVGSGFFFMGLSLMVLDSVSMEFMKNGLGLGLLSFGLMGKVGCFPFTFWIWEVLKKASWSCIFLLGVFQKYGQLNIMSGLGFSDITLSLVILSLVLTSLWGGVVGLSAKGAREIMVASCVLQTGIMGVLSITSGVNFEMYFWPYFVVSTNFILVLHYLKVDKGAGRYLSKSPELYFWLGAYMFCLMGFPPSSGFVMKVCMVYSLISSGSYFILVSFLLVSVLSSIWYSSLFFRFGFLSSSKKSVSKFSVKSGLVGHTSTILVSMISVDFLMSASLLSAYLLY